jgi:hypothetical protein
MDDERIERALRLGPPDEPVYVPRGDWQSSGAVDRDGDATVATTATQIATEGAAPGTERVRPIGVRVRDVRRSSRRSFPITIAASLTLLIGLLLAAQVVPTGPAATPAPSPDLLARLMAAGTVEIAVSNGPPQTVSQGGAYIGFDVAVAKAIAERLGLKAQVTAVAPDAFPSSSWNLALPGHSIGSLSAVDASDPYAWWPVWLAAPAGSPVTDVTALGTARVCVVRGSAGADWLSGTTGTGGRATTTAPRGWARRRDAHGDPALRRGTGSRSPARRSQPGARRPVDGGGSGYRHRRRLAAGRRE